MKLKCQCPQVSFIGTQPHAFAHYYLWLLPFPDVMTELLTAETVGLTKLKIFTIQFTTEKYTNL